MRVFRKKLDATIDVLRQFNSLHNTCCALAATSCPLTCTSMASLLGDNFRESCPSHGLQRARFRRRK